MDKVWPILVTMLIALLAVAIAYRVKVLHRFVFGKGSSKLNAAVEASAEAAHKGVL